MNSNKLNRKLFPVLGLPFDAITMDEVVLKIHDSIARKEKLFISTPNINFVINSLHDSAFRQSVINSDLSIADGMPLIWVAKLLSIPLPERIAGSSLIETLINDETSKEKPIKVFFFGGNEGIAKKAYKKLQQDSSGLKAVGYHNPGFGSVEEMSQPEVMTKINMSEADFIIVSLGAKKGQQWIEHNRSKLNASVISHLGAVVNFVAGNTRRSPVILQKTGLEWLWRIKEEPGLWKRYFLDGCQLGWLLISRILPYFFIIQINKLTRDTTPLSIVKIDEGGDSDVVLKISGNIFEENIGQIHQAGQTTFTDFKAILDLSDIDYASPHFIGLLIFYHKNYQLFQIQNPNKIVKRILRCNCLKF